MDANGDMNFASSIAVQTTSQRLASLNGMLVVVEHKVDLQGNVSSSLYEWKV
jgi:hypothetical protein